MWPAFQSTARIAGDIYKDLMLELFPKPAIQPITKKETETPQAAASKPAIKEVKKIETVPIQVAEGWEIVRGKSSTAKSSTATHSTSLHTPQNGETNRYNVLEVVSEDKEKEEEKEKEKRKEKEAEKKEKAQPTRRVEGNSSEGILSEAQKRNLRRKMKKVKQLEEETRKKEEQLKQKKEKETKKKEAAKARKAEEEKEKKRKEEEERRKLREEEEKRLEEERRKAEEAQRRLEEEKERKQQEEATKREEERIAKLRQERKARAEEQKRLKEQQEQEKKRQREQREKEGRILLGLESATPVGRNPVQKRNLRRKKIRQLKRAANGDPHPQPQQTASSNLNGHVEIAGEIASRPSVEEEIEGDIIIEADLAEESIPVEVHEVDEEKEMQKEKASSKKKTSNGINPWSNFNTNIVAVPTQKTITGPSATQLKKKNKNKNEKLSLDILPEEIILAIVSHLPTLDLFCFARTSHRMYRISTDSSIWQNLLRKHFALLGVKGSSSYELRRAFEKEVARIRESLCCFHSKVSYAEDILGIPISVKYGDNHQGGRKYILEINTPLDLLSRGAFYEEHLRKSVWKEPFSLWLPIYINKEHFARAMPYFRRAVNQIMGGSGSIALDTLSLLPKLMNSMVVNVMSSKIHASIKALEGYCWFHRLLIEQVMQNRALQAEVEHRIAKFLASPEGRTKSAVPALGEWLPLLSVSRKYTWSDVAIPYLKENFDRNAKWIIQKYPNLKNKRVNAGVADHDRLDQTFKATQVSIRLCLFHVYFLRVAKPAGVSLEQIAKSYDAFYGMPSHELKEALQKEIFSIQQVETWPEFFNYIGIACPSAAQLTSMLQYSIENSKRKGYH